MNGLEAELRALRDEIEWPPAPDLAAGIAPALPSRRRPGLVRRRLVVLVAALLAAAVAAVMAVPTTRSAVLRVFGVGAVQVRVVDELPPVPADAIEPPLGVPVSLAEAQRALPGLLLPDDAAGAPDGVFLLRVPVTLVTFVWREPGGDGVRLLVGQLRGRVTKATAGKIGTEVEFLSVDGDVALWIGGGRHVLFLEAGGPDDVVYTTTVLARNTLLVDRGAVTLRIEGDLTRAEAVEIARHIG